jgi:Ricin-type beta-trefoil lectin domain
MLLNINSQAITLVGTSLALLMSSSLFAQAPAGNSIHSGAITSPLSNLCLDVARASADDGLNVQLGSCQNGTATWDVIDLGRGEFALMNRLTKRSLDVAGGTSNDGANVQQYSWNGSAAQRWRLTQLPNRAYQIINAGSGKCLDIAGRGTTAGTNVAQWNCHGGDNQQWFLGAVPAASAAATPPTNSVGGERPTAATSTSVAGTTPAVSGRWTKPTLLPTNESDGRIKIVNDKIQGRALYSGMIVSRATSKCVDLENAGNTDGANIRQWTCNAGQGQLWDFLDAGNSEMVIVARASSSRVIDVAGASDRDGANIAQYAWNGGAHQRWRLEATTGGYFKLVSVNSNKCLDLSLDNGGRQDGANIHQWTCHGMENQQWRIEIRGSGQGWTNYRPSAMAQPNTSYTDQAPASIVGTWEGYNPAYQSTIRLTINRDGTAVAQIDGNLTVNGYFRTNRLYLGAERYDIKQDRRGFKTVQIGQTNNVVSYTRAR